MMYLINYKKTLVHYLRRRGCTARRKVVNDIILSSPYNSF